MTEMKTKVDLLIELYNEQLNQLVRTEVDLELFDYLKISEPTNDHTKEYENTKLTNKRKAKIVEIVGKKIAELQKEN